MYLFTSYSTTFTFQTIGIKIPSEHQYCFQCHDWHYSTRHVKMDSASRVSLEANLAGNASHRASRVSLDNKPRVEYSYVSGTKDHQQSSKCLANFARQKVDCEISVPRFSRDSREGLTFFVQFHVSCTVDTEFLLCGAELNKTAKLTN